MKEVDFDIIVPEYEPQAEALEAETAEDHAETAAEEVHDSERRAVSSAKDTTHKVGCNVSLTMI